jgi:hypothetical protein
MRGISPVRGRWVGAVLLSAVVLAASLAPVGCGGSSAISQEEALESVRSAYRAMAECSGYRFRSNVSYNFPDMDEKTKAQVSSVPTALSMEGEVQQGDGGYRQHSWTSGRGDKMEVYVVGGYSYRFTEATGWLYTDPSEFSLNLSDLYDFSPQDFEDMLGFVGEVQVVEDSPEKLVVYFDAGSEYLLSSLEKSRTRYEAEGRLVIYDMLYGLLSNSSTGITSHIYKDNGYLERQEVTMRLPDTPTLGTVEMSFVNEFFDYGADIDIQLPAEAESAKPAPVI